MTAEKKSLVLTCVIFIINLALIITTFFYPFLFFPFVMLVAPFISYLFLRTRFKIGAGICAVLICVVVGVKWSENLVYMLPVYLLVFVSLIVCVQKNNNIYKCFAIVSGFVTIAVAITITLLSVRVCEKPMDAVATYVKRTESVIVEKIARKYEINFKVSKLDLNNLTSKEYSEKYDEIKKEIHALSRGEVIEIFSEHVRHDMYENFLKYVGIGIMLLTTVAVWVFLFLLKAFEKKSENKAHLLDKSSQFVNLKDYDVKPLYEWRIPKGYFWGVFVPFIVIYLLSFSIEMANMVFISLYAMMIVIPYVISGISIVCYMCLYKKKHYIVLTLAMFIIGMFLFPFFMILGLVDNMLNLRKFLKFVDDTELLG